MQAIEFQTQVKNGNIEIPEELKGKLTGLIRVIVLREEKAERTSIIEQLWANPIKVENFKPLTRDEIYEP
ncbi:MAG: hypothetical protein JST85_22675 [Acidobacteria bacterium]|nr:hypothetical protein [Acidobacteriota bacterium]